MITLLVYFGVILLLFYFLHRRKQKEIGEKEQILESLEEGVLSVSKSNKVIYANYRACQMLASSKRELIGKPLSSKGNPLLRKASALLSESQKRGTILTDSFASGKVYFDLIATPRRESSGCFLILQDKSAHQKVLEVGKDFITNASHELKTPITIIKGFAETLQDMPDLPRQMVAEITQKIVSSCERMDMLVKNLLTLADLENLTALRLQECDLGALLESCHHLLLTAHPTAKLKIQKMRKLNVYANPDILELALMNLLENAVKYSEAPANIAVTVEETLGKIKLSIKDHGIGIPPESLQRIFTRFYTVDKARSRALGGTGLGLSIVKTIIEKHEGEIHVTSEVGKGSTFTISLPSRR